VKSSGTLVILNKEGNQRYDRTSVGKNTPGSKNTWSSNLTFTGSGDLSEKMYVG